MLRKRINIVLLSILSSTVVGLPAIAQTAYIETISGMVKYKREGHKKSQPLLSGSKRPFKLGDQLILSKGSSVIISCPKGKQKKMPKAVARTWLGFNEFCPSKVPLIVKGPITSSSLGGFSADVPYIISPRHTLLLDKLPTFRWNLVPGATHYSLKLISPNGIIWEQQNLKTTSIKYSGQVPLEPGVRYSLIVTAHPGKSSIVEGATDADFIILFPSEADIIQADINQITQTDLNDEVKALSLADAYSNYVLPAAIAQSYNLPKATFRSYNLAAEAISTLESITQKGIAMPHTHRVLGDLYWQTGLVRPAIEQYRKVLSLTQSNLTNNQEERTIAQHRLGDIHAVMKDNEQALKWFSRARVGYLVLGDQQTANGLEKRIRAMHQHKELNISSQ